MRYVHSMRLIVHFEQRLLGMLNPSPSTRRDKKRIFMSRSSKAREDLHLT